MLRHRAQEPGVGRIGLEEGREDRERRPDADLAVKPAGREPGRVRMDAERVDGQLARDIVGSRMRICRTSKGTRRENERVGDARVSTRARGAGHVVERDASVFGPAWARQLVKVAKGSGRDRPG